MRKSILSAFALVFAALAGLAGADARLRARNHASTTFFPQAVINAGAHVAWNLASLPDQTGHLSARAQAYCTATYGGFRTLSSAPTGWSVGAAGTIRSQATAAANTPILECYNTNGRTVVVSHSSLTVRYNYIWSDGSGGDKDGVAISAGENNLTGIVVEYNTIDGRTSTYCPYGTGSGVCAPALNVGTGVKEHASATGLANNVIRGNRIMKTGDDGIKVRGANNLVELNYITIGGMGKNQAHFDGIDISSAGAGIIIRDNFFDVTSNDNSFGRTSAIAIGVASDLTFQRNIIGYGADTNDNGYVDCSSEAVCPGQSTVDWVGTWGAPGQRAEIIYSANSSNSNVQFTNNVVMCKASGETNACFYPTTRKGITAFNDNYYLTDGDLLVYPGNN